ncbi:hypothetical protein [Methylobacterium longum]|uniref:Uncharacterized protein n=1 Tax=Methylobacterium longum TaxID=767694 RepID=A0ABT8ASM0_9HYPH|nr:hypothetical protein [Methylobacterium longum]MDN3572949.1 hypothetical protein [Methylobacterium longum]GJE14567.1 hypothetical protein FOHLNKBM_5642 [Methylobacterium longum]
MSGGYSSGYRPSANVQTVGSDPIRRSWLETASYAPDAYRAQHGLSLGLTPATRQTAMAALFSERPIDVDPSQDIFGIGRGPQIPNYAQGVEPLAFLGQASPPSQAFRDQNQYALLAQDVGNALTGQPTRSENRAGDALAFLFGTGPQTPGRSR